MNRKGVKAISGVLCASMLMGNVTPVFAATTDTQTTSKETDTKEVEVTYDKSASYFVTIPKVITLDSNKESTYSVKVEGDIPSDKDVYVSPQDAILETDMIDFYMHDQSTKHPKADVAAIVTYNKDTWNFEDVANGVEETNNKISASQLTAGNWKGTFNFNINMKGSHKHTYTSEVTKEPTCTEAGVKTFTCENGDDSYTEEIPALGHNFSSEYTVDKEPTHTEAGSKSQHCSRCDAKQNVTSIPATGHKYNSGVVTKAPTCTEKGVKTFTCVDGDHSYTEEIPATGHKYGTPTYTWSSDKSTCTAKRVCANDASHVETETVKTTSVITKAATCDEAGTKTYTATFENSAFAKQTSTSSIPATGHKYNSGVVTKKPTCTEKGVKTFTCVDGDHSYTEEIPATGHKYGTPTYTWSSDKSTCTAKRVCANDASHVETETVNSTNAITKNATCTTTGTKTYTATFKNGAFAKQTSTTSIPATGHKYETPTYTWSADGKTCTAKRVCSNNSSHIETENATITNKVKVNANCTTKGTTTYTATFKNSAFTTQTKDVQDINALGHNYASAYTIDKKATCTEAGSKSQHCSRCSAKQNVTSIPATGHKYGTPTYTWSNDKSTCTAKRVCTNNASHIETETVNSTNAITKNATCTETGIKTYTATFKNGAFAKQITTSTIPALGHDFNTDYTIDKNPTHTEDGSKSQHCKRCGAKQNIISISATGHTYNAGVITKNPTCTEKGLKTYTCIGGDHSYTEEIPATGHKYGTPTYTWSTDGKTCTAKRVCANDASHIETENATITNKVKVNATCTTKGTTTYTATFKNSAFTTQTKDVQDINALGHKYSLSTEVKATCKSDGYQIYRCNCGNNYKEILKAKNVEHVDMNGDKICDNCKENLSSGLFKLNSDECEYSWNELGKTGFIVNMGNSFRWSKSEYYNYNLVIPSHITSMGAGNLANLAISQVTLDGCSLDAGAFASSYILTLRIGKEASLSSGSLAVSNNNITKIILDEGRTTITEGMLNGCTKVTNIEIPNSVTNIERDAFKNCSSLTTLTLPNNIKVLGSYAFDGCTSLTSITYKGTTYTNKTKLTNALTSNGVNVGYFPFNSTKL